MQNFMCNCSKMTSNLKSLFMPKTVKTDFDDFSIIKVCYSNKTIFHFRWRVLHVRRCLLFIYLHIFYQLLALSSNTRAMRRNSEIISCSVCRIYNYNFLLLDNILYTTAFYKVFTPYHKFTKLWSSY